MGCFSYICKVCERPVNSNSANGEHCTIYRLKDGRVKETLTGYYDSYGRVFNSNMDGSLKWEMPWGDCCDDVFSNDKTSGMAIVHTKCESGKVPTTISEGDPDQGWGEYEFKGEVMNQYEEEPS